MPPKAKPQVKSQSKKSPNTTKEKPKVIGFMSMSGYSSVYNSKAKKPVTTQETYQVIETSNGKVTGFYEQKKDGKTIKKEPIKNIEDLKSKYDHKKKPKKLH